MTQILRGKIAEPVYDLIKNNDLFVDALRKINDLREHGMYELRVGGLIVQITANFSSDKLNLVVLSAKENARLVEAELQAVHPDIVPGKNYSGHMVRDIFNLGGGAAIGNMQVISCEMAEEGKGKIATIKLDVYLKEIEAAVIPSNHDTGYVHVSDELLSRKSWTAA